MEDVWREGGESPAQELAEHHARSHRREHGSGRVLADGAADRVVVIARLLCTRLRDVGRGFGGVLGGFGDSSGSVGRGGRCVIAEIADVLAENVGMLASGALGGSVAGSHGGHW